MQNAFWDPERRLLVLWAKKSACGSVADWVARGLLGHTGGRYARNWLIANGYMLEPEQIVQIWPKVSHSIAFVRHPFDRVLSAYMNKFVIRGTQRLDNFDALEGFSQDIYCELKSISSEEAKDGYEGCSFNEVVRFIASRTESNGVPIDGHFGVQYSTLLKQNGIWPDEIFDTTDLDLHLDWLSKRYGASAYRRKRQNHTRYRRINTAALRFNTAPLWSASSIDLAKNPKTLNRKAFVFDEGMNLIRRAHSVDYDAFGYKTAPSWMSNQGTLRLTVDKIKALLSF